MQIKSSRLVALGIAASVLSTSLAPNVDAQMPHDSITATAKRFFGNYRRNDASLISIGRGEQSVFLMDYRTGSRSELFARGDGLIDSATATTLTLRGIGHETTLVARGPHTAWTAVRRELVRIDVKFTDDTVTLAGTLWEPVGRGPFPAIVLLHGAGQETRYAMRQYPYFFVSHWYAVLTYDKRGSGKSTGNWQPWYAGNDVLAADAAAAVRLLGRRAEIRGHDIGLLGISNGAWVAVREAALASRSALDAAPPIAFVVPIVGGGVPMWRQELYRISNEGRVHHLAPADQAALDRFMRALYSPTLFDSLPAAAAIARIDSLRAAAKGTAWFAETPLAGFGDTPSSTLFALGKQAWQRELSYDPAMDLRTLRQPMLAILGGADQEVPSGPVAISLRENVPPRATGARTIVVVPGVGHYLLRPDDPGKPTVDQFDPKLFTVLGEWLDARNARR